VNSPPPALFRHWVHSREEDTPEAHVYRPSDYPFPAARGRRGFEIKPDREFIEYDFAAADGTRAINGTWRLAPKGIAVDLPEARRTFELEILGLSGDALRVRTTPR